MSVITVQIATPYKGLAPFEDSELDSLLFFGRERETEVIVANMLAAKLTVLYGPSGVGKSSILRAAVARRLRESAPDADVHILSEWAVDPALPEVERETFFILDQFEEYFLYHDDGPLHEALPALLEQPQVHVLLALREDALARLDAFQARVPGVFANRLRLDQLDANAARAAIVGPLDRWNAVHPEDRVGIESALVGTMLLEVASRPGRVEAPYLQLVLERLWEEERAAGSNVLRAETLLALGGAAAIVSAHLERALGGLPPREAEIATNALKFLVTPSRTKIAHSFGDLVGYTNESPVALQQVLEILATQRIVRAVADADKDGSRYEIFHDVLAEPVLAWRREFEGRAALAASHRRQRRLWILVGGSLALAAAMVVLAAFALVQRSDASKQRRAAQHQTALALVAKHNALEQKHNALEQKQLADAEAQKEADAAAAAQSAQKEADNSAAAAEKSAAALSVSEQHERAAAAAATASAAAAQSSEQRAQKNAKSAQAARRHALHEQQVALSQAQRVKAQKLLVNVARLVALAGAKLQIDPTESVDAALQATQLKATPVTEDALRTSLQALRSVAVLDGGGGPVNSAVFSPDGSLVATGSASGVRIFPTHPRAARTQSSYEPRLALKTSAQANVVAFAPDGGTLAAALADGRTLLIDPQRGTVRATLPGTGQIAALAFAGRYLITGSADRTLQVWDIATATLVGQTTLGAGVTDLEANPTGTLVSVLGNGDARARIFSLPDAILVGTVQQPGAVLHAAFSPDGSLLATAGTRNTFIWSVGDSFKPLRTLTGHTATINGIAFTGDGRIVSASSDSSARVYDIASGALQIELCCQHQQRLSAVTVAPDHQEIATASSDRTVRIWPSPLGRVPVMLAGHKDAVTSISYSRDGRLLLSASTDGTARLWDPVLPALVPLGKHGSAVNALAFSPSGKLTVSVGQDGTARLWDAASQVGLLRHDEPVTRAVFLGEDRVLTASEDGTARLWRTADGAQLVTYPHGSPVRGVVAAAGLVLTGGDDGSLRAWTLDGKPAWNLGVGSPVTSVAAHGGVVAVGAADGSVRLVRAATGTVASTLRRHTARIDDLAFSRDGRRLASASDDKTAIVWDVASGEPVATLAGHTRRLTSVAFSPDGARVLTASADGDARLWNALTGTPLATLRFHEATVAQAAFSSDGRWIVTAGPADTAIWETRKPDEPFVALPALGGGPFRAGGFVPGTNRIVVGLTNGSVATYSCSLCAPLPALQAIAKERLRGLR